MSGITSPADAVGVAILLFIAIGIIVATVVYIISGAIKYIYRKLKRCDPIDNPPQPPKMKKQHPHYDTSDPFNRPPNYPLPPSPDEWINQQKQQTLSEKENHLIDMFRSVPPELQNYVLVTLDRHCHHIQKSGARQ